MNFYYTYVLQSLKDHKYYYGFTNNLKSRIEQHNKGQVESTKYRRPLKLVYFEGCLNKEDALKVQSAKEGAIYTWEELLYHYKN